MATILVIFHLFAIATATAKFIKHCFEEEQEKSIEWIASFFDSSPVIFAISPEFQTSEHLAENSKRDWSDGAIGYVSSSTPDTIVQFLNFYRAVGGVTLQIRTYTYWS